MFITSLFERVMGVLAMHTHLAYLILFLGCYFETLIGLSFIVPGEVFLVSGSVLAGAHVLNIGFVAIALYSGGLLGDTSSYWIGRKVGASIFKKGRWIFNPENHKKGEDFFHKYGTKAVFFARLMGPASWVTPFLAGTYAVPYKTFLRYNVAGVFVGIGEYIVVGYFFGTHYKTILPIVERYSAILFAVVVAFFVIRRYVKRRK